MQLRRRRPAWHLTGRVMGRWDRVKGTGKTFPFRTGDAGLAATVEELWEGEGRYSPLQVSNGQWYTEYYYTKNQGQASVS